jgi:hypothetical protein
VVKGASHVMLRLAMPSFIVALMMWHPAAASAAPTCVLKLEFVSDDKSDGPTGAYVNQILTGEGYKIIDEGLLTILSASDYVVKIVVSHTMVPNYGFPVSLMGMQLYITDSSGNVLLNAVIDRSDLEANLRTFVPACNASSPASPIPGASVDAATK